MYNGSQKINYSQEHLKFLKKVQRERLIIRICQISILIIFLLLWEWAANLRLIDPFITSQPSRILKTLALLYREGILFKHTMVTVIETVIGFLSGTLLGILIAIIFWWSDFIYRISEPYLVVLNSLPKIALGPILIVWIGNGQPAIIVMALVISIIVTILTILTGFMEVDEDKIKLLKTFGATKFQILTKVVLPSGIPSIISALKINIGLSWVGVIVGEFLVAREGLGYLIIYGGQVFKLDLVMTSIIILSIIAYLMYIAVLYIEKYIVKWN